MKKTMITMTALAALMAAPALVSAAEGSAGDKARASVNSVADWTVSATTNLWNSTKQSAAEFNAWNAEQQKNKAPAKWTRVKTDKGWKIVRTHKSSI